MRRVHCSVNGPHVVKRVYGGVGLAQRLDGALRLDCDYEAVWSDVLGVCDSQGADVRSNVEDCAASEHEVLDDA